MSSAYNCARDTPPSALSHRGPTPRETSPPTSSSLLLPSYPNGNTGSSAGLTRDSSNHSTHSGGGGGQQQPFTIHAEEAETQVRAPRRVAFRLDEKDGDGDLDASERAAAAHGPHRHLGHCRRDKSAASESVLECRAEVKALRELATQRQEDMARVATVLGIEVAATPTLRPTAPHHGIDVSFNSASGSSSQPNTSGSSRSGGGSGDSRTAYPSSLTERPHDDRPPPLTPMLQQQQQQQRLSTTATPLQPRIGSANSSTASEAHTHLYAGYDAETSVNNTSAPENPSFYGSSHSLMTSPDMFNYEHFVTHLYTIHPPQTAMAAGAGAEDFSSSPPPMPAVPPLDESRVMAMEAQIRSSRGENSTTTFSSNASTHESTSIVVNVPLLALQPTSSNHHNQLPSPAVRNAEPRSVHAEGSNNTSSASVAANAIFFANTRNTLAEPHPPPPQRTSIRSPDAYHRFGSNSGTDNDEELPSEQLPSPHPEPQQAPLQPQQPPPRRPLLRHHSGSAGSGDSNSWHTSWEASPRPLNAAPAAEPPAQGERLLPLLPQQRHSENWTSTSNNNMNNHHHHHHHYTSSNNSSASRESSARRNMASHRRTLPPPQQNLNGMVITRTVRETNAEERLWQLAMETEEEEEGEGREEMRVYELGVESQPTHLLNIRNIS